jgi:hypothetical protein
MRLPTEELLQSLIRKLIEEAETAITEAMPGLEFTKKKLNDDLDAQMKKLDTAPLSKKRTRSKTTVPMCEIGSTLYRELEEGRRALNEKLFNTFAKYGNDIHKYCEELGIQPPYDLIAVDSFPCTGNIHKSVDLHLRHFGISVADRFRIHYVLFRDMKPYLSNWLENLERRLSRKAVSCFGEEIAKPTAPEDSGDISTRTIPKGEQKKTPTGAKRKETKRKRGNPGVYSRKERIEDGRLWRRWQEFRESKDRRVTYQDFHHHCLTHDNDTPDTPAGYEDFRKSLMRGKQDSLARKKGRGKKSS